MCPICKNLNVADNDGYITCNNCGHDSCNNNGMIEISRNENYYEDLNEDE